MRKAKRDNEKYFDPYEEIIRLDQLDPYEAQIKSKLINQIVNNSINE